MRRWDENLKRAVMICAIVIGSVFVSRAQSMQKFTFEHGGLDREYWLYVPDSLNVGKPLVIMLHGYGGKAENYRPEMAAAAKKYGFALCVPQGCKDPRGKTGWNVGYPSQEGMETDDVDFVCSLKEHIAGKYGLDVRNSFLCGMSNGGEMCYLTALSRPEAFTAYGSIAGLTMEWFYRQYPAMKGVPFLEVHGTSDMTSKWEGDPKNEGGWGEYIAVPIAVGNIVSAGKCTHFQDIELPVKRNRVILHRYMDGSPVWQDGPAVEVRFYEVEGGKHSWALDDLDTCDAVWEFFEMYLR